MCPNADELFCWVNLPRSVLQKKCGEMLTKTTAPAALLGGIWTRGCDLAQLTLALDIQCQQDSSKRQDLETRQGTLRIFVTSEIPYVIYVFWLTEAEAWSLTSWLLVTRNLLSLSLGHRNIISRDSPRLLHHSITVAPLIYQQTGRQLAQHPEVERLGSSHADVSCLAAYVF